MNVVETLTKLCEEMCDNYCKFPDQYYAKYKDSDEAIDMLLKEKCEDCPLSKIY